MKSIQEAQDILVKNAKKLGKEIIPLSLSVQRVLATDVIADNDYPPFNKSIVDGYACKKEDLPGSLKIVSIIRAGKLQSNRVEKGQCIKIMTGAVVPQGADCVIRNEQVEDDGSGNIKVSETSKVDNISYLGEDKKKGEMILSKGSIISSKHVGSLASAGVHSVEVYQQPLVTVFSTGAELVEPEDIPGEGQIRNSNGAQLIAQLYSMGINGLYGGIADDDEAFMEVELARSIENFNGIIISGGVSEGDFDFVPGVLQKMGFKILFHKLKVKPGKPALFAMKNDKFCFGLPGNPVSSFVQFEILVKPYLYALMGHEYKPVYLKFRVGENISIENTTVENYIPVGLNDEGEIVKIEYNNSGHVFALNDAFGLLHVPIGTSGFKKEDWGYIKPI